MKTPYNTKQKSVILEFLKENNRHYTARELADSLKDKASTATVYRQLESLVESGVVRKFITGDSACYQYGETCENNHFHLKCTKCDKLYHVDCSFLSELSGHIKSHHSFTVDNSRTVMYGICQKCSGENL